MIDGKRVVVWTPYGREETVSVLAHHLLRDHERSIVDEWWLCLNTDDSQVDDLRYAYRLAQRFDWVSAVNRPAGTPRLAPKQRNTGYFCRLMTDPDTVYVRLDDDIVYVHPDAIERLVRHKLVTPDPVCSFPIIWNNAVCSYFLQRAGVIPGEGQTEAGHAWPTIDMPYCMHPVGWADGRFAVAMHEFLLERIERDSTGLSRVSSVPDLFLYQDFPLQLGQQFSVSAFAALGSMYAGLPDGPGVLMPHEEESWHTMYRPRQIGVPNVIVGDALVSHYTFFPQRQAVQNTDILARYRKIAESM